MVDLRKRILRLPPTVMNRSTNIWGHLHEEIRQFAQKGLLFPISNLKLSANYHYRNYSADPDRSVPRLIYKKLFPLPYGIKKSLIPAVKGFYTVTAKPFSASKSWHRHTEYTRRQYDMQYWDMRLRRIPFTSLLEGSKRSKLTEQIHLYHRSAAMARNSKLKAPPRMVAVYNEC